MLICIPDVMERQELKQIERLLAEGEFVDGGRTAGSRAKRVKNNLQLKKSPSQAKTLNALVIDALKRSDTFRAAVMPKHIRPPLISRYEPGMTYGDHVDDAIMNPENPVRSDVSVTVFLNDPDQYDGGELTIQTPFGEQQVKLPKGAAVVYPSSSLHRVAPVTRGVRVAAVTWVQSLVRDPAKRQMLFDISRIKKFMWREMPEAAETDLAHQAHSNLLRLWAEV